MAFFWRWWNEQNDQTKLVVRELVKEGRLEFVIGGWCMNDEATTYYNDMIDQQYLGFKFILEEFGECARPRAAWQIDPFGHSREQASLFAQFGFDGLFLGRVDYEDFEQRGKTKTREMIWQASENLGQQAAIFTGVLPYGYNPPPNYCFDIYCNDDPIMDDPRLEDYNVDKKVNEFINYTLNQRQQYKTDNLIMTMGSDFQYSNAHMWYKNLDKLIKYVNERQTTNSSKVNIFYSTTACYLYSLYKSNATWPTKADDFFPYAHRPHAFWTGYFTSRTALKYYVRRANNYLQTVRNLVAMAGLNDNATKTSLFTLERAMGVAQHHDAVR
jgi:lysosomal alpha-mannosidase